MALDFYSYIYLVSHGNVEMPKRNNKVLDSMSKSVLFEVIKATVEPFGFHWKENAKSPAGGYFEVDMPGTGVEWRSYITKNHWIITPLERLPNVNQVHYSFPFPTGIWFHRTIVWKDGRKTHGKFEFKSRAPFTLRKFDIIKDYLALREKLSGSSKTDNN
jgi:hypothetical protein